MSAENETPPIEPSVAASDLENHTHTVETPTKNRKKT